MSRTERKPDPLLLLGDAVTLFLLLAGGLFAYLSAYLDAVQLPEQRPALLAGCALFSALAAALWSRRRGGWVALGLLCAGGLAGWGLWDRLEPAFRLLESAASLILSGQGAGVEVRRLSGAEWTAGEAVLLPALLGLTALLALGLGWIVIWARAWYLAAMAVTIPVLPAILAGVLPAWPALLASTAGWGTMLLCALYPFRDRRRLGRGVLASLAGMGAFLLLLTLALPREGYERPRWATDTRDRLLTAVSEGVDGYLSWDGGELADALGLDLGGGGSSTLSDGAEDLLAVGPRRYTGQTVLTVSTDQPNPAGRIYLRGGSAAVYTGQSWETADAALYARSWHYAGSEPLFPAGSAPEEALSHMTVSHSGGDSRTAFYPYFPAANLGFDPDGLATRQGRSYTVDYLPGSEAVDLEAPRQEATYHAFAYQQYLDVPNRAREALAPLLSTDIAGTIFPPAGLHGQYAEAAAAAGWTAARLARAAVYDPNTPAMEPGEDFVAHFLETGRGYCIHFATAGALLLRMQGIPARYVTGYTARLNALGRAQVADSDAHAWVEIYLDGFGWYPVEMTPGYLAADGALSEHPAPLISNEAAGAPEEPEEPIPDEEPEEEEEASRLPQDGPQDRLEPEEDPEHPELPAAGQAKRLDLSWAPWALGVLALLSVPPGLYVLAALGRRRSRTSPDTNRSVIDAYLRCRRLLRWGGCEADPGLEALAGKAKFSQHTLSEAERVSAWARLEDVRSRTEAALPAWKYWIVRAMRPVY